MTDIVIGKVKREPRASSRLRADPNHAADRPGHVLDDVEPDASAGDLGHGLLGREAWQKEEFEQLGLTQSGGHLGRGQPFADDLVAERGRVDPPTVVGHGDLEHPRAVAGLQADHAGRVLADGDSLVRGLDGMVEGVADQVVERGLELVEDVAVDPGVLASDLELDLLAQVAGDLADHPGEASDPLRHRPHPAGQNLVMEPAGQILASPGVVVEGVDLAVQIVDAASGLGPGPGQQRSPTPAWTPTRPETRRSSTACNASIKAAWRLRSATRASTNGRSCRAWTSDSPARPISLERLSAETRTTRPEASAVGDGRRARRRLGARSIPGSAGASV